MKERDIDKMFAQKLSSREFAFKEAYWQQISGNLGRRRLGAWWIYMLAILVMGSGIGFYYYNAPAVALAAESGTKRIGTFASVSPSSNPDSANILTTSPDESAKNPERQWIEKDKTAKTTETKNTAKAKSEIESIVLTAPVKTSDKSKTSKSKTDPLIDNNKAHTSATKNKEQAENGLAEHSKASTVKSTSPVFFTATVNRTSTNSAALSNDIEAPEMKTSLSSLSTLDGKLTHSAKIRILESPIQTETDYFKENSRWSVGAYAGVGLTSRDLSGGPDDYISKRENEEKILPTWQAGIEAHYELGHWDLSSGVNYLRIGEKTSYSPEQYEHLEFVEAYELQTIYTSYWIVDSLFVLNPDTTTLDSWQVDSTFFESMDTVMVLVEDTLTTYETFDLVSNNQRIWFEYLEIPLFVGYTLEKRRWNFGIRTGISLGILTGHGGLRVNQALNGLVAQENSAALRKVLINYQLRLSVGYRILSGTTLYIEPAYRNTAQSVFKSTVNQRYKSYGLNFGVLHHF